MKPLNLTNHTKMQAVLDYLQEILRTNHAPTSPEFEQYFQREILPHYPTNAQLALLLKSIWYAFSPLIESIVLVTQDDQIPPELRSLAYLQHQSAQNFQPLLTPTVAYVFVDQPTAHWLSFKERIPTPSHLCFFATKDSISQVVVLQSSGQNILPCSLYVSYR